MAVKLEGTSKGALQAAKKEKEDAIKKRERGFRK